MFRILAFAGLLLVAGVFVTSQINQTGRGATAASTSTAPAAPNAPPPTGPRTLVLKVGSGGAFELDARVDGKRVHFIVDTGATHIALRESDAARLGIRPAPNEYTARVSTANGIGRAAVTQLRSIEVGQIVVRNAEALIVPDRALGSNLLGMSFLSKVRWSHERGRLTLEQ
jgi:aspartyl protease family protein